MSESQTPPTGEARDENPPERDDGPEVILARRGPRRKSSTEGVRAMCGPSKKTDDRRNQRAHRDACNESATGIFVSGRRGASRKLPDPDRERREERDADDELRRLGLKR